MRRFFNYFVIALLIMISGLLLDNLMPEKTVAEEINYNMGKINELSLNQIISSNPYDYIDNNYYNNIIKLGMPAVSILEEQYNNNELNGLNAYIAALAIQEITGIQISEDVDETWKTWQCAEEFFAQWNSIKQNMSKEIEIIATSSDSIEDLKTRIGRYGIFGEAYVALIMEKDIENMEKIGFVYDDYISKLEGDSIISEISKNELKEIIEYLEK